VIGEHSRQVEQKIGQGAWWLAAALGLLAFSVACAPAIAQNQNGPAPAGASASASAEPQQRPVIDHVMPARDSIGRAPTRFSWTPIEGADDYAIGIWNEVDQLVWHQTHIPTTSIDRPEEIRLEPGTYFWSISALRGEQELADSGLAAFVVRTTTP
jgi:hypothetical protein